LSHSATGPTYPLTEAATAGGPDGSDRHRYWTGVLRRRWSIAAITLTAIVLALLMTRLAAPMYRGSVLLQIEHAAAGQVDPTAPTNADGQSAFYGTQFELLRSRALARRVIDQLALRATPRPVFAELAAGVGSLWTGRPPEPAELETLFLEHLTVTPVKDSHLVRIAFDSPVPDEAAAVANALAAGFISATRERGDQARADARAALAEQSRQVQADLAAAERRLAAATSAAEGIDPEAQAQLLMTRLSELSREQAAVEAARIAAQAHHQQLAREGPARSAEVLANPLIQTLKEHQAELSARYQEKLQVYKPDYPKMKQLRQQLDVIEQQIEQESAGIGDAARAAYETTVRRETRLAARIDALKSEVLALQTSAARYQELQRAVDTQRERHAGLLERLKAIEANPGSAPGTIAIVDAAQPPRTPIAPLLWHNLAIALAIGLCGGIAFAVVSEALDDTLKTSADTERGVGAPVLSRIPWMAAGHQDPHGAVLIWLPLRDPRGAVAAAYRSLCAALNRAGDDGAPRVIHFCSAAAGEGKTSCAGATAVTFARTGSKVLLIDCDLRRPSIHHAFNLPNTRGLANCLSDGADPAAVAQATAVAGLFVISSGPRPPHSAALLGTARMTDLIRDAARRFDQVILDGPPVAGRADALILAGLAQATLMVVAASTTRAGALTGSLRRLRGANANILGAILVKYRRGPDDDGSDAASPRGVLTGERTRRTAP
jgi:capsular exopolysaccharide synthesis family protein